MRNKRARFIASIALVSVVAMLGAAVAYAGNNDDGQNLSDVRAATAPFHNLDVAMAAGYGAVKGCAQNPGVGGMGQHYVKGDLVADPALDTLRPEALVYEPRGGGGYRLVAVEYIVLKDAWHAANGSSPPRLFDEPLMLVPAPNAYGLPDFYEIHLWLWKNNPQRPLRRLEPARVLPRPAVLDLGTGLVGGGAPRPSPLGRQDAATVATAIIPSGNARSAAMTTAMTAAQARGRSSRDRLRGSERLQGAGRQPDPALDARRLALVGCFGASSPAPLKDAAHEGRHQRIQGMVASRQQLHLLGAGHDLGALGEAEDVVVRGAHPEALEQRLSP